MRILEESVEDPHCVGSPPDACNNGPWERSLLLEHLFPRFPADDRLKVPHDTRERMGTHYGSDDIMGILNAGDPIPNGLVCGVFKGSGP